MLLVCGAAHIRERQAENRTHQLSRALQLQEHPRYQAGLSGFAADFTNAIREIRSVAKENPMTRVFSISVLALILALGFFLVPAGFTFPPPKTEDLHIQGMIRQFRSGL